MYYAHISPDRSRKQSNREHLEGTAKLAGDFRKKGRLAPEKKRVRGGN